MEQERFSVLKKKFEKEVTFNDYLQEEYSFQTISAIYLISFSLIYLIVNKEYAITVAFSISSTLFFTTYFEKKKSNSLIHNIFGYIAFVIAIVLLSVSIIYIRSFFPKQATIAYAVIVCLSVLFGFISGIRLLYITFPYSKKLLGLVSIKSLIFIILSILWIIVLWINYNISSIVESFNLLKDSEEMIIGRLSTSATVLTVGVFLLNLIRNKIIEEKINNRIFFEKRVAQLTSLLKSDK